MFLVFTVVFQMSVFDFLGGKSWFFELDFVDGQLRLNFGSFNYQAGF
jgi:hypothetical protein